MGTTIWSGLVQGAIFALVANGFQLSLIPSGVFNFAQGALVVGGSFFAYLWLTQLGVPSVVALILNVLAGVVAGALSEVIAVRPLRWGRAVEGGHAELVTTVGLATALTGAIGLKWGYLPLPVPFIGPDGVTSIFSVRMAGVQIVLVLGAVVVAVALHLMFKYTLLGRACLAVAEDREAAMLRGINVNRLSIGAFAAAGALAGLGAMAIGPVTYAIPTLANSLALGGFVALAIGGERSFIGGLLGGLLIGLVSVFATQYLGSAYPDIALFAVLMLTLQLRPKGLGGGAETRIV